jgi:hypothetical protein
MNVYNYIYIYTHRFHLLAGGLNSAKGTSSTALWLPLAATVTATDFIPRQAKISMAMRHVQCFQFLCVIVIHIYIYIDRHINIYNI